MRIAVLIAASLLVAGCSQQPAGRPGATQLTPITPSHSATPTSPKTSATSSVPAAAPGAAASPAEAIAWVEAAPPVDGKDFRVALRNGVSTPIGDDVAFTTPSGISCMTDARHGSPALACLVDLIAPPAQPPDVYGVWKGGWVDFDGASVQVGSAHGDPGRFSAGQGAPLPLGGSLAFGDFRCRADTTALVCANYTRKKAVRYSDDGVDALGCTRQTPPAGIGIQFAC